MLCLEIKCLGIVHRAISNLLRSEIAGTYCPPGQPFDFRARPGLAESSGPITVLTPSPPIPIYQPASRSVHGCVDE
jgi:hypothetical protein